jgi:hypothetical protein
MQFRIQYISNLHLCGKAAFPLLVKPAAKYLALAGNIGKPGSAIHNSFIDYCTRHWEHVFYVPGSLEYPHLNVLEEEHNKNPRLSLLYYNQMAHFVAKEHVAVLGMPFLDSETHRKQFNNLIDYWEYQKAPICVITHTNPTKLYTKLFRPSMKAWIYGYTTTRESDMYGTMYLAANGALNGKPACIDFAAGDDSGDKPLQELAAFTMLA